MRFRLLEKVYKVGADILCDYVGNVRDLLINKPQDYRISYVPADDVWIIGDSYETLHLYMCNNANEFGMLPKTSELVDSSRNMDIEDYFCRVCKNYAFIPTQDMEFEDFDERNLYEYDTYLPIKTGLVLTKTFPLSYVDNQLYTALKPYIIHDIDGATYS